MQVVFKDKSLGNINNIPFLVNKFVMRTVYAVCRQLDKWTASLCSDIHNMVNGENFLAIIYELDQI